MRTEAPPAEPRPQPRAPKQASPHTDTPSGHTLDAAAFAALAVAVLAFTHAWTHGHASFDGPGEILYLRLAGDHFRATGHVPLWEPSLWSGAPVWIVAPVAPVLMVLPLVLLAGAEATLKISVLGSQIVGAWGAYMLARWLWRQRLAALLAGFVYGLHPLFAAQALFGQDRSMVVIAVTPWVAWTFLEAMRRKEATRYVVVTGLLAGFAVLEQAEHAYGVALLCAVLLLLELVRSRQKGAAAVRRVLARAAGIGAVALGVVAHWLLPFAALQRQFVLSPPEIVQQSLREGLGAELAHHQGGFVTRAAPLHGRVSYAADFVHSGYFYLGAVCLALTLVTVLLQARRNDDGGGELNAILLASAVGLWLSTGAIPLVQSDIGRSSDLLPLVLVGMFAGVLVGTSLRRLGLGRRWVVVGMALAIALIVSLPYLTPYLALQRLVPLLESVRFSRFFVIAALGLALGTAYPLVVLRGWARQRHLRNATLGTAVACLIVAGAFLVDVAPYRSFYRSGPPVSAATYQRATASLDAVGGDFRVAAPYFPDAAVVDGISQTGFPDSVGWPHPVASKDVWRLTAEAFVAPPGYRDASLALSGTAYTLTESRNKAQTSVDGVALARNPAVLPMARAYDEVLDVGDNGIGPELAVALSQRNIGVVTGSRRVTASGPGAIGGEGVPEADACSVAALAHSSSALAGEVATACSLHRWIGLSTGISLIPAADGVGARFTPLTNGLAGVSVWLSPGLPTELRLWELSADGRTLGTLVATSTPSNVDPNGLTLFPFAPIPDSAGRSYVFTLSCTDCSHPLIPRMVAFKAFRGSPDLVEGGARLDPNRVAAFSLVYQSLPGADRSQTTVQATSLGAGQWRLRTSGSSPSLVVLAESWFPGWSARVDGKAAAVVEADGAFLGVVVGPGEHTIALAFHRPGIAAVGRIITGLTLAVCLLLLWRPGRRPRLGAVRHPDDVVSQNGQAPGQGVVETGQTVDGRRPKVGGRAAEERRPDGQGVLVREGAEPLLVRDGQSRVRKRP